MIKGIYLKLLHFGPFRVLLRRYRAKAQELCGYSDPFYDMCKVARAANASLFIDIGCHTGETLLRFVEAGMDCPVAAFDPMPESLERARQLLIDRPNISFYQAAMSDADGKAEFHCNKNEQTSSLLMNDIGNTTSFPEDTTSEKTIEVDTIRLDSWAKAHSPKSRALIKCDTQGAEGKVVRGGIDFIRKHTAAFYCEVMLGKMYQGQISFEDLSALLEKECGMVLQNIYPCLHDAHGRAVQFDAMWVKPQFLLKR
jgi:FkbM family methyltransferase